MEVFKSYRENINFDMQLFIPYGENDNFNMKTISKFFKNSRQNNIQSRYNSKISV